MKWPDGYDWPVIQSGGKKDVQCGKLHGSNRRILFKMVGAGRHPEP